MAFFNRKRNTLRKTDSIDENAELDLNSKCSVKYEPRPDVCPDVTSKQQLNVQEPDVVQSSSSSSSSSSRVSSFASSSSSERSFYGPGNRKVGLSQTSFEEETSTLQEVPNVNKTSKTKLVKNLSHESIDDNVFEKDENHERISHSTERNQQCEVNRSLSCKGQRNRSEFSSGYATGSGGSANENSMNKTHDSSQENEIDGIDSVEPISYSDTRHVPLSTIENDFKPKCPQVNTTPVTPSEPAQLAQQCASHFNIVNNNYNSSKEPSSCEKSHSSRNLCHRSVLLNGELSSVERFGVSYSNGSLQNQLLVGSVGTSTHISASSVISSGSFYINSSDENKFRAIPDSIIKHLCGSSVPGYSVTSHDNPYQLDDLLSESPAKPVPDFPSSSYQTSESHFPTSTLFVDQDLATMLERTARCDEIKCLDEQCQQIKDRIKELANGNIKVTSLSEDQKSLLHHMCRHANDCTLPKCPFSWCESSLNEECQTEEEKLIVMKKKIENFTDDKILHGSFLQYLKISEKLPYDVMPVEGKNWSRLCMMDNSRRTLLAVHNCASSQDYWVIKKNVVDDDYLWHLCTRLRQLNSSSMVEILWAAKFNEHVLICSEFEGYYSLQDSLKASAPYGLDLGLIQFIMLQLTSASQHLHALNIVYLNWTSGNILSYQSEEGIIVKLCNFSTAACVDYYDVGFLRLALPTHILMPELCNDDRVTLASDVWGLGCLLFELVTGYPVWHDQRHISSDALCKMMKENFLKLQADPAFNLTSVSPKLSPVVSACWEMDPKKRISLIDLQVLLLESFLTSNPDRPVI